MVERQNRRQRILIITLIIICVLLVTVYSRESKDGLFHRLQRFSLDVVSPLQKGMSKVLSPVKDGQKIKQGDKVGEVGATGLATGPHLHFQMGPGGRWVNPYPYLRAME